jgi:DGQHR domain-containing protein
LKTPTLVCAVPAVRYSQRAKTFFLAAVPAPQLLRVARVDHWDPRSPDRLHSGYQRRPEQKRLTAIAKFIAEPDSYFSTGGLLNSRIPVDSPGSPLAFECAWEGENGLAFGVLRLYEVEQPLWVVDMQHRLEGLRLALASNPTGQLSELPVAVTIASGLTRAEEINEFLQINTKQKKVSTALARRALALLNTTAAARASLSRSPHGAQPHLGRQDSPPQHLQAGDAERYLQGDELRDFAPTRAGGWLPREPRRRRACCAT